MKISKETAELYFSIGAAHLNSSWNLSIKYLRKAKEIYTKINGKESKHLFLIYYYLGNIFNSMREPIKAIKRLNKATKISDVNAIGLSFIWADIYSEFGKAYCELRKFDTSMNFLKKAEEMVLLFKLEKFSDLYLNYGNFYAKQQKWDLAVKMYLRSEEEWYKVHGSKENVFWELNLCLGIAYGKTNNREKSFEQYQICIEKIQDYFQERRLAEVFMALSGKFFDANEYHQAIKILFQVEQIYIQVAGKSCKELANVYYCLGLNYQSIKDIWRALNYSLKAEDIFNQTADDNGIICLYSQLATIYMNLKEYDKSIEYLWKMHKFLCRKPQNEKKIIDRTYLNIGNLYKKKGDHYAAIINFELSLKFSIQKNGENNELIGKILMILGIEYMLFNDNDKALQYLVKAEKIIFKLFGINNFTTFKIWSYLSLYFYKLNDEGKFYYYSKKAQESQGIVKFEHKEAIEYSTELINIYLCLGKEDTALGISLETLEMAKKASGENTDEVAELLLQLSEIYFRIGNYKNGIDSIRIALRIFIQINGKFHPSTLDAYKQLAKCYEEIKDFKQASECKREIISIEERLKHLMYLTAHFGQGINN